MEICSIFHVGLNISLSFLIKVLCPKALNPSLANRQDLAAVAHQGRDIMEAAVDTQVLVGSLVNLKVAASPRVPKVFSVSPRVPKVFSVSPRAPKVSSASPKVPKVRLESFVLIE